MMTEHKYGPWQAHNATPDSTCPPDAAGKRGQWQMACETRIDAEKRPIEDFDALRWDRFGGGDIAAYRILQEPVRGEVVLYGQWFVACLGRVTLSKGLNDTHCLVLPTLDGSLVCGRFAQVDDAGALVKDGAIVSVGAV